MTTLYKRRVADGFCGACGKVKIKDGSLCSGCREKSRQRTAARRAENKKANKCIGCGKRKPVKDSTRCKKCKEVQRLSRAKQVEGFKQAGLCSSCGERKPKKNCSLCQYCIDQRSEISSEHYFRRKEAGLCRFCNRKPKKGSVLCSYHKELYRDYRLRAKLEAFEAYGGAVCCKCGEDDAALLEIDHIEGGGRKHLREIGLKASGYQFYLWLRRNKYPKGFRVLCPTCNKQAHYDKLAATKTH